MPRNPNKIDYSKNFPIGFEIFEEIQDPRHSGHTLHHFGEIVFMAFVCILCGVKSYDLMEEYCTLRMKWFKKWIGLPNGIPSYNTFSNPLSPPSAPVQRRLQGPPAKSNFLAIGHLRSRDGI